MLHLWSYRIPQQKRKSRKKNSDELARTATYVSRHQSKSGSALETNRCISKTIVSYFEAWLAVSPYFKSTYHHCNFGARFTTALAKLSELKDDDFEK